MTLTQPQKTTIALLFLIAAPLVIAYNVLGLGESDLSHPFLYGHGDDIWQFTLTKVLKDTGWVLWNPYLGAPEVASWHHNAAAQSSALHSVIMLLMSPFFESPFTLQQTYYLINFPLICLTTYWACRLLSIARLPAICAALLFGFNSMRFNFIIYSFLPNYFAVPLIFVSITWIIQGKFDELLQNLPNQRFKLITLMKNKSFLLGLSFAVLMATADGYYAFFSLLLLGFALGVRLLTGGWSSPKLLIPGVIYLATLTATSLFVQFPLYDYKHSHHSEFYPNGVEDPALSKHAFEAEVYSSSLKLLIAPLPQHHIAAIGKIGSAMFNTSNDARKFPAAPAVSLGTVGSLLLLAALVLLIIPKLRTTWLSGGEQVKQTDINSIGVGEALLAITLFVFLASISGGIGTLVALVFPTIRAYDRFAIFLVLALLLLGAYLATLAMNRPQRRHKLVSIVLVGITAFGLYDQIPKNYTVRPQEIAPLVASESTFVKNLESKLPKDSMVYQYPYSQYLRDNKYYGWGSFAHVRLYLYSHNIHWSNGGAKNSPGDDWNYRISQLPLSELLDEVRGLGFKAFVVDRTVIRGNEYSELKDSLHQQHLEVIEDPSGEFAYALLPTRGYQVAYAKDYKNIDSIDIQSKDTLDINHLPALINGKKMQTYLTENDSPLPLRITRAEHPELFIDGSALIRGNGDSAIVPITDMKAQLVCTQVHPGSQTLEVSLVNGGNFNLTLGQGSFPIKIGVHTLDKSGQMLSWDSGYRLPAESVVKIGETKKFLFDLKNFPDAAKYLADPANVLQFQLVQDANAWFANVSCSAKP